MALTQANEQNRLFPGGGHVALMVVIELPENQKCAARTTVRLASRPEPSQAPLISECALIQRIT